MFTFSLVKGIVKYGLSAMNSGEKGFSCLVKMLPGVTVILGLIAALQNIAGFIVNKGYIEQLRAIKESGFFEAEIETYDVSFPARLIVLFFVLEVIGIVIEFSKNGKPEGMRLLKNSALSWLIYILILPLLTYVVCNALALGHKIILAIIAVIFIWFLFGVLGTGGAGAPESSGGPSDTDRKIEKLKGQAASLHKRASDYEYYNKRQAEGAVGYQHMNAKLNREVIRDSQKQAESIEREIEKLEKKKNKEE